MWLTTTPCGDIGTGVKVSNGNLPLHSLFQSVTMKIADNVVSESKSIYPLGSLLEMLLNYEEEVMQTRLTCEGFEMDTHLDEMSAAAGGTNEGLKAGHVKFNKSKEVRLFGRPLSALCHQEKLMPPGI